MRNEDCLKCKHCEKLYYSEDGSEIVELRKQAILKNKELFYKVCKSFAKFPKKLVEYVREVDCDDTSSEPWMVGYLRKPKTKQEEKEAVFYCVASPFEPIEIEEVDYSGKECSDYKKRRNPAVSGKAGKGEVIE